MGTSPLRAIVRAFTHEIAARLAKRAIATGRETELLVSPPWEITINVASLDTKSTAASIRIPPNLQRFLKRVAGQPENALSALHQNLIGATDTTPRPGRALAKRAGYPYHSRLRQALADLVRQQLLDHGPDGYRRPR